MVCLPFAVTSFRSSSMPPKMKPDLTLIWTSSGMVILMPPKAQKALMSVSFSNLAFLRSRSTPPKIAMMLEPWKDSLL